MPTTTERPSQFDQRSHAGEVGRRLTALAAIVGVSVISLSQPATAGTTTATLSVTGGVLAISVPTDAGSSARERTLSKAASSAARSVRSR